MGITIKDVAQAASVSTATVSRALRGLPNVDAATRARIVKVASDLDYVISPSASRLASGRTGTVAVVTPHIARWFFSTVLSGIESVLQQAGMDLLLLECSASEPRRHAPASRLRRRVDGVVVISLPDSDPNLREVLALDMPTALVGTSIPGMPGAVIDDVLAGQIATQHLINMGHQRIGVIAGSPVEAPFKAEHDRQLGFDQAMNAAGLEISPMLESYGYFTIAGGEQAMTALLTQRLAPTAVFAMSDEMAFGAMKALRSHDLQVGRDISLIGVDGHDMAEYLDLTTVVQPVAELGRLAAEAVLEQIMTGMRKECVQLPTQLVVRRSTSPLRTPGVMA